MKWPPFQPVSYLRSYLEVRPMFIELLPVPVPPIVPGFWYGPFGPLILLFSIKIVPDLGTVFLPVIRPPFFSPFEHRSGSRSMIHVRF